ncbi:hypothetical protein L6V77_31575 [Myxococcota bacterium]|nr:hypothetical protein [Myxococcota bacterium]
MKARTLMRFGLTALALFWLTACDDGASTGGRPPSPPAEDVTANGMISLKESEIGAAFEGGSLRVTLPVRTTDDVAVTGRVDVDLMNLADATEDKLIASGSQEFEGADPDPVTITLPLTPGGDDAAALASYALYWRVDSSAGALHGRRSVFSAWSQRVLT